MPALHVVLAAPAAADAAARRDSGDFLHPRAEPPRPDPASPGPASPGAPRPPAGACAVVVDVLRATSTLARAFEQGATRVIPAATVAEAFELRGRIPDALLCGEREGKPVPGFDLGNSPFEYERSRLSGRPLVFASTNGSQALLLAAGASRTLLAAFVNASAVIERLAGEQEVWLIASGKLGRPSLEDLACVGWIVRALGGAASPAARAVAALAPRDALGIRTLVQGASQGRYLRSLGPAYAADVEFCATLDSVPVVPAV